MKKSKVLLLLVGALIVLVAAAIFILLQNLDALVKAGIEKYGSQAAGTAVRVESVRIELKEGRGTIRGLTVANPQGFSKESIFSLGEISLALDPASLTTDLPIVKEIRIGTPVMLYEVNAEAQTNLGVLQKHLKRKAGGDGQAQPREEEAVRLLVKRINVAGGQGILDLSAVGGRRLEAKLPPLTLNNIGGRKGITPTALGDALLAALADSLEQVAARQGVEQAIRGKLGEEAGRLQERLDDKLGPGSGDALKQMLGR